MYAIADSDLVRDSGSERFNGGSCKSYPVLDCSHSVYSSVVPDFSSATENLEDQWAYCQNCLGRGLIQSWILHASQPCNYSYIALPISKLEISKKNNSFLVIKNEKFYIKIIYKNFATMRKTCDKIGISTERNRKKIYFTNKRWRSLFQFGGQSSLKIHP